MDDTALLATSRAAMHKKLKLLYDSACSIDMIIHPSKPEYIVVNSDGTAPFLIGNVKISRAEKYTYLGSTIIIDNVAKQVEQIMKEKQRQCW